MIIRLAEFLGSATKYADCPKPVFPEYAFTGRSNVGKSSLINMLCGKKNLARISSTPGKTTLINHFLINSSWYLVDLPGYGYAKSSRTERETWKKMVTGYLLNRKNLMTVFVLVDINVPPQESDFTFMKFLGSNSVPFVILFTKTDKARKSFLATAIRDYKKKLSTAWEEFPQMIITSSIRKSGREEIQGYIEETNKVFKK
jgi:GTP-binding protein